MRPEAETEGAEPAASYLDAMTGHRMPGGCEDCDAYQRMTKQADGVYVLTVHHDASCPWLNTRQS